MAKKQVQHLFVYGTLLRELGSPMHALLDKFADFVGKAELQARLYEVDQYPGLVLSDRTDDIVQGELYFLHDIEKVLQRLDAYEGCSTEFPEPQEFKRTTINITLANNDTLPSWVYLYNLSLEGLEHIRSGNYVDFIREQLDRDLHSKQDDGSVTLSAS